MRTFVTGCDGQLGKDVMEELIKRGHFAIGSDIAVDINNEIDAKDTKKQNSCLPLYVHLDITNKEEVKKIISKYEPDAIIHCAAWTDVDAAEEEENREAVYSINVEGTKNVAEACEMINSKMIYLSTDYVFDGEGSTPWGADCKEFNPLNYYGKTKLKGEEIVSELLDKYYIVRTSWVFGSNGKNFVKTMISLSKNHESLWIVNDQIGTPTYTPDLAVLLVDMAETDKYGYYNATNEGKNISWCSFAKAIFEETGSSTVVRAVSTEEYGMSKAKRPKNSRLDKRKLAENGFQVLPDWNDALRRFLEKGKK